MRSPAARTLADYGTIARRSWWLIAGAATAAIAVGICYTIAADEVYESTTSVLVLPTATDADVTGARTFGQINLDTEAQLVKSTEVAQAAAERLSAPPEVELTEQLLITVPPNTSVLQISFRADSPEGARDGTIAFSEAYLDHRRAAATASIESAITTAQTGLDALLTEIGGVEDELDSLGAEEDRTALESSLDNLRRQAGEIESTIAAMEAELNATTPGRIINQPDLPADPISPNPPFNITAALGIGLPLGLLLAWARHRLARRVHCPADLVERCALDVLGSVPKSVKFQRREVFGAYSTGGRAFSQLRNVIASRLTGDQRVVVIAGVASGPAAGVVAANLATAMSRAGDRVTAVAANPSTTLGLSELFGTSPVPGLADVWSGRVELSETRHAAPRQPSLSIVGPGAAARATGPTSEAAAATFTELAEVERFVVVDAPPLSCSTDAQLLAAHADAVVLVVQSQRDSIAETSAAAAAMRQIDTPLLGAVLLPNSLGPMNDAPMPGGRPHELPRSRHAAAVDETPTDSLTVVDGPVDGPQDERREPAGTAQAEQPGERRTAAETR